MKRQTIVTLVTVLLLVAIALPVGAQTIWQTYGNVRAKQLNATGAADLDSTLNVDGATTLAALTAATVNVTGNADTANQTITISETTTARMAGNFAMGQYDTITLIGQGVTWHEVARSNN